MRKNINKMVSGNEKKIASHVILGMNYLFHYLWDDHVDKDACKSLAISGTTQVPVAL